MQCGKITFSIFVLGEEEEGGSGRVGGWGGGVLLNHI